MQLQTVSNAPLTQLTELIRESIADKQGAGSSVVAKLNQAIKAEIHESIQAAGKLDVMV